MGVLSFQSFSLSKNNKLSCFQYKLIHRILALNPYLSKFFNHGLPKKYRWKQCKLDSKRYYFGKCTV